jgi:hypothetical protein
MYFILAADLAMTHGHSGQRRHKPHAAPLYHNYGDMNCVTSPQTQQLP